MNDKKEYRLRLKNDEFQLVSQYRELKKHAYKVENDIDDSNGSLLKVESNLANSVEDIIKEFKIDERLWECEKFEPGSWTTPVKTKFFMENEDEKYSAILPAVIENKKSKAVFKKKTEILDFDKFKKEFIEDIRKKYTPKSSNYTNYKFNIKNGNLLEITIPDLHLGKMGWAEETNLKDYDIKIAVSRFENSFDEMVAEALRIKGGFEEIVFIVGNDFFNSDTAYPLTQTTRGTPQQEDSRWQKIFRIGRNLMIDSIEKLKVIAPVKVKIIPGNHDMQRSYYLGSLLEIRYENDNKVEVDNSPHTRKYHRWGKCFLGFAHGARKDEGIDRLVSNFMNELSKQEDKEQVLYKEIHCGDIHHYKEVKSKGSKKVFDQYAEDIDGVLVKYLRTLMFNDSWESQKGYISQKGAHVFIWNKDYGNTHIINYNKY